ncbi:MAG TPA: bifunctional nuclease family protein [Acidimicrobiia bacterium]|nr:bifunctional nuclease family protein [Acidimicrobiia bacterium]
MRQVEITGIALEATTGAPLVVLQETDAPHRTLPIFIGGTEAAAIGLALAGETPDRPLTYDVMAELVELLHARVDRVDVTELRDGAFLAEMTVSGPGGDQRLDTRPSDAIALALRLDAPLYVSDEVLEAAGSVFELSADDATSGDTELLDDDAIDAAVAAFRAELDDVDPASFDVDPLVDDTDDPGDLESWGD